jgi:hypothetical protein
VVDVMLSHQWKSRPMHVFFFLKSRPMHVGILQGRQFST